MPTATHNTTLLLLLTIAAALACCSALMLPQYARHTGGEYEYAEEEEHPPTASLPPNHITRIVHPSEIRVPQSLEEFTNVVGADMAASLTNQSESASAVGANDNDNADMDGAKPQRQEKALTYTELSQLLALWQLEKERNAYEMQLDRHRHGTHAART